MAGQPQQCRNPPISVGFRLNCRKPRGIVFGMITRYTHGKIVWVDLENPTHEEVRSLMEEFGIDPLVAEELLTPSLRAKVEPYDGYLYMVLHFPAARHSHTSSQQQEIDFIVGGRFVITTRYDTIDPLHKFSKVFEVNSILDRTDIGSSGGYMLLYMLTKLYRSVGHELDYLDDRLETAEGNVFSGQEKAMVVELSNIGRDLLNFKQALVAHRDILSSLEGALMSIFGEGESKMARSVIGDYYRVHTTIQTHSESLKELRETNTALLYTKQNEIMKVLTIMAFVTFPLSLIAGIFGMNTAHTPLMGRPFDFWIIVGAMFVCTALFFLYFKVKKWL